ncbi:MAG: hypothetical protein ACFE9C_07915 [Candidatus Hodarchaeota archaeon]
MVHSKNYKLVILISAIIISSSIGIGIGYFVIQANSNNEDYTTYKSYYGDICFEYGVKSICDGYCEWINETLDIIVSPSENEVIVNQITNNYCSPEITDPRYFGVEMELVNNNLTIREIFDPLGEPIARCICPFRIHGTISNLTTGSYNLRFIWVSRYVNHTEILKVFEIII